jgi:transcriptional regulator with XRE-family HTH domain
MSEGGTWALREARKAAGLTAEELGKRVGVSAAEVRRWERSSPCAGRAFQVAAILGVDPKTFTYAKPNSARTVRKIQRRGGGSHGGMRG